MSNHNEQAEAGARIIKNWILMIALAGVVAVSLTIWSYRAAENWLEAKRAARVAEAAQTGLTTRTVCVKDTTTGGAEYRYVIFQWPDGQRVVMTPPAGREVCE